MIDIEGFRKHGYQAIDRICDYLYSVEKLSVVPNVEPGFLKPLIPSSPPERGEDFQAIADDFQKLIIPGLTNWQHPLFFGYFPTACSLPGILGDLYAASVANPGFNWFSCPAATELEGIIMDWLVQLIGLSPAFLNSSGVGGGCLQTTASDSALVAVVAARAKYQREHPDVKMEDLIIYTTTQTHSLGLKAGLVLGLSTRSISVKAEDTFALRGSILREVIEEDRSLGKHPFVLIATIGTTSSGANDNLEEVKSVLPDYPSLWVHVDAAWAGSALICPEFREQLHLNAINEVATSFTFNLHKWALVNFDASTLFVRDRNYLTEALDITPAFLRTAQKDAGLVVDYKDWQFGLGRKFRSVKVWFVLRDYGVEGLRERIRQSVKTNEYFVARISKEPLFSILTSPSLALTVFRIQPDSNNFMDLESYNALNKIFYNRLLKRKDIYLTNTVLNGTFCVRFVVCSQATEERHVDQAIGILKAEAKIAITSWQGESH